MVVNLGGRRRKGGESKREGEGGRKEERGRREGGERKGGEREEREREERGREKGGEREDYPFPTRLVATSTQQAATERTVEKKHGSTTDLPLLSNASKHCVCVILS